MLFNSSSPRGPAFSRLPLSPRHAGLDLTQGGISRTLFFFSLPIVLQMSIQPLFHIIDRIFIGHLGPSAFNAVTNAGVIVMLVINLSAGVANGATSYVARLVGQGELKEADNAAVHCQIIMLGLSLLFIIIFLPLDRSLYRMLGVLAEALAGAHEFSRVIILGNLVMMFSLIGMNILRGEGDSVTPLVISIISVVLNLLLAPPLIFAPEDELWGFHPGWMGLGVQGGALATVISRAAGSLALIIYLRRGRHVWTFTLENFHWRPRHMVEILRVGLPMILVNFSAWLTALVFLRVLNKDQAAVVAYGIGTQLDMLAVLPAIGLTLGVVAMVGQNFGAGEIKRTKATAWIGGLYAVIFSALIGFSAILFPRFWISLFNPGGEAEIQRLSLRYIYIVGPSYPFIAMAFVLGGAFQGLGRGLPPLLITVFRFLVVSVPLVLFLPGFFGPSGAWVAVAAAHVGGGFLSVIWLRREFKKEYRRRERSVERAGRS